jgi:hypothetical protein
MHESALALELAALALEIAQMPSPGLASYTSVAHFPNSARAPYTLFLVEGWPYFSETVAILLSVAGCLCVSSDERTQPLFLQEDWPEAPESVAILVSVAGCLCVFSDVRPQPLFINCFKKQQVGDHLRMEKHP